MSYRCWQMRGTEADACMHMHMHIPATGIDSDRQTPCICIKVNQVETFHYWIVDAKVSVLLRIDVSLIVHTRWAAMAVGYGTFSPINPPRFAHLFLCTMRY